MAANAFSNSMPQPNFSSINSNMTYGQAQQSIAGSATGSGAGGMDMTPMLAKMDQLIGMTAQA